MLTLLSTGVIRVSECFTRSIYCIYKNEIVVVHLLHALSVQNRGIQTLEELPLSHRFLLEIMVDSPKLVMVDSSRKWENWVNK